MLIFKGNKVSIVLQAMLLFALTFSGLTACDDDEPISEKERTINLLANEWSITSVSLAMSGGEEEPYDAYTSGSSSLSITPELDITVTNPENLPKISEPFEVFPSSGRLILDNNTGQTADLIAGNTTVILTLLDVSANRLVFSYPGSLTKASDRRTITITATR